MRPTAILFSFMLLASCTSAGSGGGEPRYGTPDSRSEDSRTGMRTARMGGGFDILPPRQWWRDESIARVVNLNGDQIASLDALGGQADEIDHLQNDLVVAARDLRTTVDSEQPSSDDILKAGQRLQTLRDDTLSRQLRLLVAERAVLSQQQWSELEQSMRDTSGATEHRDGRRGGYGGKRGGGMGGRRPGWPG